MTSVIPRLKSPLASACHILGLALAVYLALLKYYALPCVGPGHCQEILYSQFGSVFRVPVGVYGALLWFGIILVRNDDKRDLLLLMLAGGTALFMVVQFFVLRSFCLYCTLHALAAWGALLLHRQRPRLWAPLAALALAGLGFGLTRAKADLRAQASVAQAVRLAQLADSPAALPWLGPLHPRSPTLILSLDCPACLDVLDQLIHSGLQPGPIGPAVFLKADAGDRELTLAFIAAVLSQQELSRRDAFLGTATLLLTDKNGVLGDPADAATRLASLFPDSGGKRAEAERILAAQTRALAAARVGDTTPLLINRSGEAHALFKPADLFP